ncbi:MAG TPA: hypothetical protein VEY11_01930 [Pyrinomonadaceae bacterium]|nr:hypothetical protein [Pyrinomonadaceae bacterium]
MEPLYYGTPDFAVAEFQHRKVLDEIKMLMTAFDCVIADNSAIYCSGDVTTGKQFYRILKEHEVSSRDELKVKLGVAACKEVMSALVQRNIERGIAFTENIRRRGHTNLINPGPLVAPDFDQQHYLYLWEWIIIRKACEARFNENWEYSSGCTLEYAIAARKGISRRDHLGNILDLPQAVGRVERAVAELKHDGMRTEPLELNLSRLKEVAATAEPERHTQEARS